MMKIFNDLFVLDIANNHFGDENHGIDIIKQYSNIIKKYNLNITFKFQFRNLDTYLHNDLKNDMSNHYVKRFATTKLKLNSYKKMVNLAKKNKIKTSCTPFDEDSVANIEKLNFDFIKVASVSCLDWSLMERVCKNKIPKIISTGGKTLDDIDKIVSFLKNKKQKFSLMHCVSIYPTNSNEMNLHSIKQLKERYPDITIGWSTHEDPNDTDPINVAYGLGARMFERHIGIKSKKYDLNKYSSDINQFENWIKSFLKIKEMLGVGKNLIFKKEIDTLLKLDRGVYIKKNLKREESINKNNIYYAFPKHENQLAKSNFSLERSKYILKKNYQKDEPILTKDVSIKNNNESIFVYHTLHQVRYLFNISKIKIGKNFSLEISHHFGVDKFNSFGCILFTIIDKKEYAKKIVVQVKNQHNPTHKHKFKNETFNILFGKIKINISGKDYILNEGDQITVAKGKWHSFTTLSHGCIFEEISNGSFHGDSIYKDKNISLNLKRKTAVSSKFKFVF